MKYLALTALTAAVFTIGGVATEAYADDTPPTDPSTPTVSVEPTPTVEPDPSPDPTEPPAAEPKPTHPGRVLCRPIPGKPLPAWCAGAPGWVDDEPEELPAVPKGGSVEHDTNQRRTITKVRDQSGRVIGRKVTRYAAGAREEGL